MIEVALRKSLGSFRLELNCASSACTLGLLGPSGSGKSTLLHCISGIVRPEEGRITVSGRTLTDTNSGLHLPPNRRGIGYVFQDGLVFPHLNVMANLRYGFAAHGPGPTLDEVVHVLELGALLKRKPTTLSGGEARRVALGRALLSGPRLLLLDEPLSGLDRTLATKTLFFLRRIVDVFRIPTVYVSHTPSDVCFLCDDAWVLRDGQVVAAGPPQSLVAQGDRTVMSDDADYRTIVTARREASPKGSAAIYRLGQVLLHSAPDDVQPGSEALLSIYADDIIIAREKPMRLSARNVIPAKVTGVGQTNQQAVVAISVDSQGPVWIVKLTPAAVRELQIEPGAAVHAIIKATSIQAVPVDSRTTTRDA